MYYNFDYYHELGEGAFKNRDNVLKDHISKPPASKSLVPTRMLTIYEAHCLDTIRQQLMCTVDLGMLGQVWWNQDYPQAYPDFNTQHKCRNFDAVRQWAEDHQAPEEVPEDYLLPPVSRDDVYPTIP